MRKLLPNLILIWVLAVILTSCGTARSYNFKTDGLSQTDSSYLVTSSGQRIDAASIDVKPGKVTVDGKPYPLNDISSIRSKKMYFAVSNGKLYLGEVFGKINLLYELIQVATYSPGYSMGGGFSGYGSSSMPTGSTTQKKYYIQKRGSTEVDKMNVGTVLDYVSDNEEALAMAKGARRWKNGYLLSWGALTASSVYALSAVFSSGGVDASGNVKGTNLTGPFIACTGSLALMFVSQNTYTKRMFRAIDIYNR